MFDFSHSGQNGPSNKTPQGPSDEALKTDAKSSVVITGDMPISEVIQRKPRTIRYLMTIGMGCIACPSALMETVEEAALVHGFDPDMLVQRLNDC